MHPDSLVSLTFRCVSVSFSQRTEGSRKSKGYEPTICVAKSCNRLYGMKSAGKTKVRPSGGSGDEPEGDARPGDRRASQANTNQISGAVLERSRELFVSARDHPPPGFWSGFATAVPQRRPGRNQIQRRRELFEDWTLKDLPRSYYEIAAEQVGFEELPNLVLRKRA
jgi:hypothetical protein